MFESPRITGPACVAPLDVGEHLGDAGGRERMADRGPDRLQLPPGAPSGLAPPRGPQGLPHQLGHGHALPARDTLDVTELGVVQQNLQALTHVMSMIDSS